MLRFTYAILLLFISYQFVVQATNTPNVHSREEVALDDRPKRTLFNIVCGCLSTTIICAWAALHPNIPPQEGPLKGALRKLELMIWTIMAPEILLCWALKQRLAAMTVRDVYNGAKGYKEDGICQTLKGWFSMSEVTGAVNPAWTLKHGHFLVMGGIHLVEPVDKIVNSASGIKQTVRDVNVEPRDTSLVEADTEKGRASAENPSEAEEGRVTILTLEMLRELVKDKEFKIRLTEAEITHRSKGYGLSKAIFILHSSWFIIQCIARHVQGLDLTQLELTTLALASLNGITFILWWDKPLGAQTLVRVYMKRKLTVAERNAGPRGNSMRSELIPFFQDILHECFTGICDAFLCRDKEEIWANWIAFSSDILAVLFFPITVCFMTFTFTIMDLAFGGSTSFPVDATHVPTFYVPNYQYLKHIHISISLLLGTVFGAIHCAGWNLPFPSHEEQTLWRFASLAVAVIPTAGTVAISFIVAAITAILSCSFGDAFDDVWIPITAISLPLYVCSRLVLLGQALALLQHLPANAFVAVDWSQFYPHFL